MTQDDLIKWAKFYLPNEFPEHEWDSNNYMCDDIARAILALHTRSSALAEAASHRVAVGHNDTCSHALSESLCCSCGNIELKAALAAMEAK